MKSSLQPINVVLDLLILIFNNWSSRCISTLVYCEIMLCKDVDDRVTDRANCKVG